MVYHRDLFYCRAVLFLIYVNDLPDYIRHECLETYMFADDLAVSIVSDSSDSLSEKIINISHKIEAWCDFNNLLINSNKTEILNFDIGRSTSKIVSSVRFLGIHVESGLGWHTHIDNIAKKISKGLYMLRILKTNITTEALHSVYYAYIHSHLNYGITLWGNHTSAISLFKLQKRALRLIYGVSSTTHCKPFFIQSGILTLPCMFVLACLLYVKSNVNNFTTCNTLHKYPTRHNTDLYLNKCNFTLTQKSFLNQSLKFYNFLPVDVRNFSPKLFKRKVAGILRTNPLYNIDEFYEIKF